MKVVEASKINMLEYFVVAYCNRSHAYGFSRSKNVGEIVSPSEIDQRDTMEAKMSKDTEAPESTKKERIITANKGGVAVGDSVKGDVTVINSKIRKKDKKTGMIAKIIRIFFKFFGR